jgi:uncharacterized protein YndB with AHSA1/START domain
MASGTDSFDMVLTRTFDAPNERVWRAWSVADEGMKRWGPELSRIGLEQCLDKMDVSLTAA